MRSDGKKDLISALINQSIDSEKGTDTGERPTQNIYITIKSATINLTETSTTKKPIRSRQSG